jgi:hypothetical protein
LVEEETGPETGMVLAIETGAKETETEILELLMTDDGANALEEKLYPNGAVTVSVHITVPAG